MLNRGRQRVRYVSVQDPVEHLTYMMCLGSFRPVSWVLLGVASARATAPIGRSVASCDTSRAANVHVVYKSCMRRLYRRLQCQGGRNREQTCIKVVGP